jgi:hypothetical protein
MQTIKKRRRRKNNRQKMSSIVCSIAKARNLKMETPYRQHLMSCTTPLLLNFIRQNILQLIFSML